MYTTTYEKHGRHTLIKLTNIQTGEFFSIIPDCGAKVHEIVLRKKDQLFSIIDNEKDPDVVMNDNWHKGEFLIPFPNRIKGGTYEFMGQRYSFDINMPEEGNAIHGIVYNRTFSLTQSSYESNELTFEYLYSGDIAGYPFPNKITYTFKLLLSAFSCSISVTNNGNEALPLGVGWHPYFTLGTEIDNLELLIPESNTISVDDTMIPTGEKEFFNDYVDFLKIEDTIFDTGFEILNKETVAITSIRNPQTDLTIELQQKTGVVGFNYVQIFTPPGRKTIALEPMTCPADAFNSNESLIIINPNESWNGDFQISLK